MDALAISELPTGTYGIDPIHSSIGFAVKYNDLSMFRSAFKAVEGQLQDGVLTGSVPVESIAIEMPRFREHVLSADFFDAESFPQMTFASSSVEVGSDGKELTVGGELLIRGVSHPVTATGSFATGEDPFGNDRIGLTLHATIDRRAFGLTWQNPLPAGGDAVGWHVAIDVELQLVKPPE
jgi:polyisoprenoid-binding protein YceI